MNSFQYIAAATPADAVSLIGPNGRYLAGGIDLLGEMKDYIVSPNLLVALRFNEGGDRVQPALAAGVEPTAADDSDVSIDSQITIAELAAHPRILARFPAVAQAAAEVGSPQIRNVATLGGNLLQHSRCWYYRQPDIVCLKRGGSTCYAPDGENKYLSLFSGCACVSPIVSNLSVALSALDATVQLRSPDKSPPPALTMEELYAPAWKDPAAHNAIKPEVFLESVRIPAGRTHSAYRQQSEKSEFDWALVSCAAAGNVRDGKIYDARVALGAVAPAPYMVHAANHYLEGKALTEETVSHAADLMLKDAKALSQNGYKIPLAHTLIRRTLLALNS
jgi:xanthine dehydrogenase YagS FAD-binding subunit